MSLRGWLLVGITIGFTMQTDPPTVIAHRGASWYAPEHTLAAWDLAVEMGADYLEQDLQMTADSVLVVLHDEDLERTARGQAADCTGLVIDKSLEQVRRCDVGSWFNERNPGRARAEFVGLRISTLEEVLSRYAGRARFYIETKNPDTAPGMEEELIRLLDRHALLPGDAEPGTVLIQSFSSASLLRVRALNPDLPLVKLEASRETGQSIARRLDEIARYAMGIGPSHADVDATLVEAAHAHGLVIHPYTVDAPADMDRLLGLGVDGMFTDRPDLLRQRIATR